MISTETFCGLCLCALRIYMALYGSKTVFCYQYIGYCHRSITTVFRRQRTINWAYLLPDSTDFVIVCLFDHVIYFWAWLNHSSACQLKNKWHTQSNNSGEKHTINVKLGSPMAHSKLSTVVPFWSSKWWNKTFLLCIANILDISTKSGPLCSPSSLPRSLISPFYHHNWQS